MDDWEVLLMETIIRYNGDNYYYRPKKSYYVSNIKPKKTYHREFFAHECGVTIKDFEVVHHIDGNPLNNSLSNLMLLSHINHQRLHARQRNGGKMVKEAQCSIKDCSKKAHLKHMCQVHYHKMIWLPKAQKDPNRAECSASVSAVFPLLERFL